MIDRSYAIKQRTRDIWKLYNHGMNVKQITKLIGTTESLVAAAIHRGQKSGNCKIKVKTVLTVVNGSPLSWGYMKNVVDQFSPETAQWLFDNAEKCECKTVAEYIGELVLDAFEVNKSKEAKQ